MQTSKTIEFMGVNGYHTLKITVAQISNAVGDLPYGTLLVRNSTSGKLEKFSNATNQRPIGILGETITLDSIKAGDVTTFMITKGEIPASILQLGAFSLDTTLIDSTGYTLRTHLRSVGIIVTQ